MLQTRILPVETISPIDADKMGSRETLHKHALPIHSPIILDAIFAFRLRTCHLEVLYAIHGHTHLASIVIGGWVDGAAKHFKTHSYSFATTP